MSAERTDRLPELILLMAERLRPDPTYGATKLNKALFFADHLHYKRHDAAISGAAYERLPRAPAPRGLLAVRQDLIDRGEATLETRGYLGHLQRRLLPLRAPRQEDFTESELALVAEVADALRGHSHTAVLGWQLSREREEIPYESAFLSTSTPNQAELDRGAKLAADLGLSGSGADRRRGPAGGGERVLRRVAYECRTDGLEDSYPRAGDVLAGIAWALARWPDGFHRIPGTRLHLLKTEWPIPALGTWFSLDDESRCTVRVVEEILPYVPEEDGTD
jgi:Antitoxin SocA-like, Panacea domain